MQKSFSKYYPINTKEELEEFLKTYLELVKMNANKFQIDLYNGDFKVDHLGFQTYSKEDFDACHEVLLKYSDIINDTTIHNRRNRLYEFKLIIQVQGFEIPKIEIFEPKPTADLSKLKLGIEHIAFIVENYEQFTKQCKTNDVPIEKEVEFESGSKFFKTIFMNLTEIEFRNDSL